MMPNGVDFSYVFLCLDCQASMLPVAVMFGMLGNAGLLLSKALVCAADIVSLAGGSFGCTLIPTHDRPYSFS